MSLYDYPDHDFDLMKVGDAELFFALKSEVLNIIKNFQGLEDCGTSDIYLDEFNCTRRRAYGKDYNLYPVIVLPFRVREKFWWREFSLILNSFEVCLLNHEKVAKIVISKNLNRVFEEFMTSRFPESNYLEKKKQYLSVAETIKKVEDGELFK